MNEGQRRAAESSTTFNLQPSTFLFTGKMDAQISKKDEK
jgi:hypothetical protein